jgi:hypothetical protein
MEYVSEKKMQEVVKQIGTMQQVMVNSLKEQGITEEEFMSLMNQAIPMYMESMFKGKNPLEEIVTQAMKESKSEE